MKRSTHGGGLNSVIAHENGQCRQMRSGPPPYLGKPFDRHGLTTDEGASAEVSPCPMR